LSAYASTPPNPAAQEVPFTMRPAEHVARFLEKQADDDRAPAAILSFDPSLTQPIAPERVRETIRRIHGTDIGFDVARESFTAMTGLVLSTESPTAVPRALMTRFAAEALSCGQGNRFRFFRDVPEFGADLDCTAVAAAGLYEHGRLSPGELVEIVREMLRLAAPAGCVGIAPNVLTVYWDDDPATVRHGLKQDAVACANALYTVFLATESAAGATVADPAGAIAATVDYVRTHLVSRRYLEGTRYYPAPEVFLHAVSRLCARFDPMEVLLGDALRRAVLAEMPAASAEIPRGPGGMLNLAMLAITETTMGLGRSYGDLLARFQHPGGPWPAASFYRMGRFEIHFGSPLLTALFTLRALEVTGGRTAIRETGRRTG
jgi:hypothetical protein